MNACNRANDIKDFVDIIWHQLYENNEGFMKFKETSLSPKRQSSWKLHM